MYDFLKKLLKIWPILLIALIAYLTESVWLKSGSEKFVLSNSLEAKDVNVSSKVSGRIVKVFIKEGDRVKKGEKLLILDGEEIKAQLNQGKANLLKSELELSDLIMGARNQELEQAKALTEKASELLDQSKAKYENSKIDFERISALYKEGAVSKQIYDKSLMEKLWNEKECTSREKELSKAKEYESLTIEGPRKEQIKALRANVEYSRAKVKELNVYANELTVTAPLDGEISSFDLKEGEIIKSNQPLLTITDLNDVFVRVYIPANLLSLVKIREKVKVKADTYNNEIFDGYVSYIGAQAEFTPRNVQTKDERTKLVYPIKIQIINKENKLRDGMYVTVDL